MTKILPFIIPGLLYGIGCLGLATTFRFLKFPDFTSMGSIICGGVVCLWVTNQTYAFLGILSGVLIGYLLGFITGLLINYLKIQPVLAGIIVFTASYSIGYCLSSGGTISYSGPENKAFLLYPVFSSNNAILLFLISIIICIIAAIIMKTKPGFLLLAMTASKHFINTRHRDKGKTLISTLAISNSLIGFAGALFALQARTACVVTHTDFLPISLGAIFGGNAIVLWISRWLNKQRVDHQFIKRQESNSKRLVKAFSDVFSIDREDSSKIGVLYFTYVIGSLFITLIQGLVYSKAWVAIPFNFSHLLIAIIITLCVWWAGTKESLD